jgi:ankyrin repeat protein
MAGEDPEHKTALQAALKRRCWNGDTTEQFEFVKFLLQEGAVAYPEPGKFNVELYLAAKAGNCEVIRLLLDLGADVNYPGGECGTPLQGTASSSTGSHADAGKLLVERGANIEPKDPSRAELLSPLLVATRSNNFNLVKPLLEKRANHINDALLLAAQVQYNDAYKESNNRAVAKELLRHGADVNWPSRQHGSVLHSAVETLHIRVVELLLEHGVDVNAKFGSYCTVLQAAAISRNPEMRNALEIFEMLIQYGADVNAGGGKFRCVLQAAAYYRRTDDMQYLIRNGANINLPGGIYGNALQAAASPKAYSIRLLAKAPREFSTFDKVEVLLKSSANINAQGGLYGTAL